MSRWACDPPRRSSTAASTRSAGVSDTRGSPPPSSSASTALTLLPAAHAQVEQSAEDDRVRLEPRVLHPPRDLKRPRDLDLGQRVAPVVMVDRGDVVKGAAGVLAQLDVQRAPARLDEQGAPAVGILDHPGRADVRLRMHERLNIAELARQLDRPFADLDRLPVVLGQHQQLRLVAAWSPKRNATPQPA
jgi:hypothetical protein